MSAEVGPYLRFSVGHKGQFGNELLKFELLSTGELTYCNDSNYKMEGSIERKCRLTPILIQHISNLIYNSGILQQSDTNWPLPDQVGREELEIIIDNRHVSFTTTKLGSLAEALGSKDPKGLEIFYYLTVELKALILDLISCHFKTTPF